MPRMNWLYTVLSLLLIALAMIVIVYGPADRILRLV